VHVTALLKAVPGFWDPFVAYGFAALLLNLTGLAHVAHILGSRLDGCTMLSAPRFGKESERGLDLAQESAIHPGHWNETLTSPVIGSVISNSSSVLTLLKTYSIHSSSQRFLRRLLALSQAKTRRLHIPFHSIRKA